MAQPLVDAPSALSTRSLQLDNPPSGSPSTNEGILYASSVPASRTLLSPTPWYAVSRFDPDDSPRDVAQYTIRPFPRGGGGEEEEDGGGQLVDILIWYRTETSNVQRSIRVQVSEDRTRREEYQDWLSHVYEHGVMQDSTGGIEGSAAGGGGGEPEAVVVPAGWLEEVVGTLFAGASADEVEDAESNAAGVLSLVYNRLHEGRVSGWRRRGGGEGRGDAVWWVE
ncbi:hypothetical protein I350_02583 [Cryptococcus amylolentus CBS 6273]|uniref:Uncharacterized protein n=1 Tax=Cryptococcus amylolentus CBS 6273 TaxID=1296118 RepID=A0A1E3K774_9TREE|nr:hypothetical protein I350_02583 [Cryptococcus amylolentus CBS 6273]